MKIKEIKISQINLLKNNNYLNIINVDTKLNKVFNKISSKSNKYIEKCFNLSLQIIKKNKILGLINGPVSKTHFLKKKYLGITEYLTKKTNSKNTVMLIYNPKLSVSPVTTHVPFKNINKNLTKKKIINNVIKIKDFYKHNLKKKPSFAVLCLNPHCENSKGISEEKKIIIPAIKYLKKNKINVYGPYPSDTFFLEKNIKKFDVVIGMYHDQVLTPIKTLYKFDAINITLGLPFIRISPDHGPNSKMVGKNKSDPRSLFASINFLNKIS